MPDRTAGDPDSSALALALRAHVGYLRDLGLFDLYRRQPDAGESAWACFSGSVTLDGPLPAQLETSAGSESAERPAGPTPEIDPSPAFSLNEDPTIAARKSAPPPIDFTPGPRIAPELRAKALDILRREIGPDCTRCPLGTAGRQKVVFGDGDANARLFFVGEGPGADEDAQGVPFVGKAGQLLNNMIAAMSLKREEVYIANIVKCRPPSNRVPEPVEAHTCSQFLFRQIDIVRPQVIVALGATAATYLLGSKSALSALRGRPHAAPVFPEAKLFVTYHPAYLLRDPRQKREAWAELQLAMAELRLASPRHSEA